MANKKRKKSKTQSTVISLLIIFLIIAILSSIFSIFEIEAYQTVIANNTLESTLVTVKNILSVEGFQFIIGNIANNLSEFTPLVYLIIALLGIGVCEKSGLLHAIFTPFKKIKMPIIIYLTLFIGIVSSIIGELSFVFLIPLVGIAYKYLEKNPVLGILIMFIGISIGYGTGIIFNYNDHLLGLMTQASASLEVDKNYKYSLFSNIYIMIFSTILLSYIGTIIIDKFLVPKFTKKYQYEEELEINKNAKKWSFIVFGILFILLIYFVLPIKLPAAGILLNNEANRYIEKLFDSTFGTGLVFIISLILIICGYVYGKKAKTLDSHYDITTSFSTTFENLGIVFVFIFFVAQLFSIIEWSNLGNVISCKLIELMSIMKLSGIPLIISFILIVILSSIFMPDTISKWNLMYPTIVPLFMQSNITPGFTLFIFKVADGIGKCFNPIFVYFIIMLAFLNKYQTEDKKQYNILDICKLIYPTVLMFSIAWLVIICLWYLIGFPIGVGIYSTL